MKTGRSSSCDSTRVILKQNPQSPQSNVTSQQFNTPFNFCLTTVICCFLKSFSWAGNEFGQVHFYKMKTINKLPQQIESSEWTFLMSWEFNDDVTIGWRQKSRGGDGGGGDGSVPILWEGWHSRSSCPSPYT